MNNADTNNTPTGGKVIAWVAFVFGSLVSIAGNVLASRLPPAGAPADWQPNLFAQIGAGVWSIALLLAVEVLSRVRWPAGAQWKLARYGGVVGVALGSAAISYSHIRDVLLSWNYDPLAAGVGPLVLDGLMVVSGFALLADSIASRVTTPAADPAEVPMSRASGTLTLDITGHPESPLDTSPAVSLPVDPTPTLDPQVTGPVIEDDPRPDPTPVPALVPAEVPDPDRSWTLPTPDPVQAELDLTDPTPDPRPLQTPTPAPTLSRVEPVTATTGHAPDPGPDPDDVRIATQVLITFAERDIARPNRDVFAAALRDQGWRGRNPAAGALLKHVLAERELVSA